jgi:glycerophosphoryl diester phosphodiesterase
MTNPVSVSRGGHRTFLKWHRARRRSTDPVFTGRRILEGMALGASVEVDIVRHRDGGFAVLHDHTSVARETTGQGSAASLSADEIRRLHLRANDGLPIADYVMLLEDLCGLLQAAPPHREALLQLDYKEGQGPIDRHAVETFAATVSPVAGSMILSSGEADSVAILAQAVPRLRTGFDPSDETKFRAAHASGELPRFVDEAIAASPRSELFYLYWEIITLSSDAGFDIIDAFHRRGRRIDAYTIRTADETTRPIVERLLDLRVDQITTDDPEGLATLMESG